jgi:hypothetical protein
MVQVFGIGFNCFYRVKLVAWIVTFKNHEVF